MNIPIDKTRLSSKRQVVIPKRIRDALNMKRGDDLAVLHKGDQIIICPLTLETLILEARKAYEQGETKTTEEVFQESRAMSGLCIGPHVRRKRGQGTKS